MERSKNGKYSSNLSNSFFIFSSVSLCVCWFWGSTYHDSLIYSDIYIRDAKTNLRSNKIPFKISKNQNQNKKIQETQIEKYDEKINLAPNLV